VVDVRDVVLDAEEGGGWVRGRAGGEEGRGTRDEEEGRGTRRKKKGEIFFCSPLSFASLRFPRSWLSLPFLLSLLEAEEKAAATSSGNSIGVDGGDQPPPPPQPQQGDSTGRDRGAPVPSPAANHNHRLKKKLETTKHHFLLLDLLVERGLAVRGEARAGQGDVGGLGELGHVGELGLDLRRGRERVEEERERMSGGRESE